VALQIKLDRQDRDFQAQYSLSSWLELINWSTLQTELFFRLEFCVSHYKWKDIYLFSFFQTEAAILLILARNET
jgi:hypothetical protein